ARRVSDRRTRAGARRRRQAVRGGDRAVREPLHRRLAVCGEARGMSSSAGRILRSQAIVLRNLLRGWPLVYTGTAAMTIDDDDLTLAAGLLADRRDWMDE